MDEIFEPPAIDRNEEYMELMKSSDELRRGTLLDGNLQGPALLLGTDANDSDEKHPAHLLYSDIIIIAAYAAENNVKEGSTMRTSTIHLGEIKGYLDMPEGYSRVKGAIIMIPCFTCVGTLDGLIQISDILTERGYATLRIDMTGVGESSGDFSQLTIQDHIADAVRFTEYTALNISGDIILVGHGIGGVIGILANREMPVKGIITLSTPFDDNSYDFDRMDLSERRLDRLAEVFINDNNILVRKDFMGDIDQAAILSAIEACTTPILSVFFEEEDETVPYLKTMDLIRMIRSPIETLLLKRVTHFMDSPIESYYVGNLIDIWSQNKLNLI